MPKEGDNNSEEFIGSYKILSEEVSPNRPTAQGAAEQQHSEGIQRAKAAEHGPRAILRWLARLGQRKVAQPIEKGSSNPALDSLRAEVERGNRETAKREPRVAELDRQLEAQRRSSLSERHSAGAERILDELRQELARKQPQE